MSYGKILRAHKAALATHDTICKRLRAQKTAIEAQEAANEYPNYIRHVVAAIGKMICRRLGKEYEFEAMGPFGLCNESSLTVMKKIKRNLPSIRRKSFLHLTFIDNQDGGAMVRDTSKTIGKLHPDSLGNLNGMNHPSVEIPVNANADWFIRMAGKRVK